MSGDGVPEEEADPVDSGPFCPHWGEPGDCTELCVRCEHQCREHAVGCEHFGCDCDEVTTR